MDNFGMGEGAARVVVKIAKFREEWQAAGRPNAPLEDFSFDLIDKYIRDSAVLDDCDKITAVTFSENVLEAMRLPEVEDTEVDHNFLVIHWRISRFQQLLFELLSELGLGDDRNKDVLDKQRHEKELMAISEKIDKISSEIKEIRAAKKFGGMSVSVLGISTPLETIWKAIQRARKILSKPTIDSDGLTKNLEAAYVGSRSVWETLSSGANSVTEAVMLFAESIVTDVGAALTQVLGMRRDQRRSSLGTVRIQLNGNLSLSELRDVRDHFKEQALKILDEARSRSLVSEIRRFEFGISIDNNRMDLVVAETWGLNSGTVVVDPVFLAPASKYGRGHQVQMPKKVAADLVVSFFDAVINGLQSSSAVEVDMTVYEPVISIVVNRRAPVEDFDYMG